MTHVGLYQLNLKNIPNYIICDNKSSYDQFVSDSPLECYEQSHTSNNTFINLPNVLLNLLILDNIVLLSILMKLSAYTIHIKYLLIFHVKHTAVIHLVIYGRN